MEMRTIRISARTKIHYQLDLLVIGGSQLGAVLKVLMLRPTGNENTQFALRYSHATG